MRADADCAQGAEARSSAARVASGERIVSHRPPIQETKSKTVARTPTDRARRPPTPRPPRSAARSCSIRAFTCVWSHHRRNRLVVLVVISRAPSASPRRARPSRGRGDCDSLPPRDPQRDLEAPLQRGVRSRADARRRRPRPLGRRTRLPSTIPRRRAPDPFHPRPIPNLRFDDPLVIAGQGTLALELLDQARDTAR